MARPSDLLAEIAEVAGEHREDLANRQLPLHHPIRDSRRRDKDQTKRLEALSLHLAGVRIDQIAERMEMTESGVRDLIRRTLERAENTAVEDMRATENARLDRAQAAIWDKVLQGDLGAINTFLHISAQRSRINNLYAPTKIELAVSVRNEMEERLAELQNLVLKGEVVDRVDRADAG